VPIALTRLPQTLSPEHSPETTRRPPIQQGEGRLSRYHLSSPARARSASGLWPRLITVRETDRLPSRFATWPGTSEGWPGFACALFPHVRCALCEHRGQTRGVGA